MRPRTLDEMVGQKRLLAPDSALRRAVESGRVHSMILWGPPGCGKTTLALLLAEYADAEFRAISAVLSGLPEVRPGDDLAAVIAAGGLELLATDVLVVAHDAAYPDGTRLADLTGAEADRRGTLRLSALLEELPR